MKWPLILLSLLVWSLGAASARSLSGKVTDVDGKALPRASVTTNIVGMGTLTDAAGEYRLNCDTTVKWVTFSSIGYQSSQYRLDEVPETVVLLTAYYEEDPIVVRADRARAGITPIAFENVTEDEIARDYTVGEFPLLLESTPNLYAYSDAGTPLGYSYVRIRGFDDKRIVTYINGVPLNDPEDQATYFVDLPDFAANITDIQVQRGVGNSLYGDASFGGSLNIVTSSLNRARKVTLTSGYGEYTSRGKSISDIYKQSIEYSSGLLDGRWLFSGRFSKQKTGGYRHHSWYEGWSYYFSIARIDPRMTTELYVYGGPIKMHLSYWGAPRDEIKVDRRFNPLAYANETDNFNQPHYHLHNSFRWNDKTTLHNTLYYIRGRGFYEQFKESSVLADYGIDPSLIEVDTSTGAPYATGDLVRQQWVKKNQYGWNPRLDIEHARGNHALGGSFYYFESDHYGQVVWAEHISGALDPRYTYYNYFGDKWVGSFYAQEYYRLTDRLSVQATAQLRYQRYQFDQIRMGAFLGHQYDVDWYFFSPRIGVNFNLTPRASIYGNFAVSSRTPTDASIYDANDPTVLPSLEILDVNSDSTVFTFGDPTAQPEHVYNVELGGKYRTGSYAGGINLFWMEFVDEILPYGGVDDDGLPITINADRSIHAGIELTGRAQAVSWLTLDGHFAYNYNRIREYEGNVDVWDANFEQVVDTRKVDFADKKVAAFPDYLGNLTADLTYRQARLTWRNRFFGKQYMELYNIESLAIDQEYVASLSLSYTFERFLQLGRLTVSGRIDNLFDNKYEVAGYGGNYAVETDEGQILGWAEYFVAAERSFYGQVMLELF